MPPASLRPPPSGVRSIKEWPAPDRPRERLQTLGPAVLTSRELLALVIETGRPASRGRPRRSPLDLAGDLLSWSAREGGSESLRRLLASPVASLCEVHGIGPAKAARVLAALDLGRRAAAEARPPRERVDTPRDVYERLRLAMRDLPQEEFRVLLLNTGNEVLREVTVSRGTLSGAEVHPRDVFRPALAESAACLVLAHNHPSGALQPSPEDCRATRALAAAGRLLGIPIHDHVIVGEHGYFSFLEEGLLERL